MNNNYLVISDLQICFEADKALEFCRHIQKHLRISKDNILCVGDEIDALYGSFYKKSIDGNLTANQELDITREKLKRWISYFPYMRVCISNHGMRWARKAVDAELPSQMIRKYQEVLEIPKEWKYRLEWKIKTKHPFRMIHGMGYSGKDGHINAALDAGMSTVIGHLHSFMGVAHLRKGISEGYNHAQAIWAMNAGCLIDVESFAFHYGRENRNKPALGCGAVVNNGSTPMVFPYET